MGKGSVPITGIGSAFVMGKGAFLGTGSVASMGVTGGASLGGDTWDKGFSGTSLVYVANKF
jgi:hypothetical protein